ncbi:MAG: HEAT repeat domain-containing protein, partial [Chloroflexota bacterium]|nr:HEAT repeat domain-containing protein [Chloroflexota bacterium]
RFTVKDSLIRIGRASADPLLRYLADADGAPAPEALEVAAGIADARFLAPALRLLAATDPHMRARAATLVGAIGGARATGALLESLVDPHADVRAAAARALGHLGHWPAAAALAACMRDASWEVRRAAATALKAIGPAGVLLLHRALTDRDRFTRDMARQILQLPVVERPVAHDLRELASAS